MSQSDPANFKLLQLNTIFSYFSPAKSWCLLPWETPWNVFGLTNNVNSGIIPLPFAACLGSGYSEAEGKMLIGWPKECLAEGIVASPPLPFAKLCQGCCWSASHSMYSHSFVKLFLLRFLFFPRNWVITKPRTCKFELFITWLLTHGEHYAKLCESLEGKKSHHGTKVHFLLLLPVSGGNVRNFLLYALKFVSFKDITLREKKKRNQTENPKTQ